MIKILTLTLLGFGSLYADPGITIDIDIIIYEPTGITPPEMAEKCK